MPTDPIPALSDPWLPDPVDGAIPLAFPCAPVVCSKYDPANSSTPFTILTNVICQAISQRLGANPPTARFRYIFGTGDPDAPQSFEEALSTEIALPRSVDVDDRIVVHAQRPDGSWHVLFDGFALGFHLGLSGGQESVSFDAIGAVKAAWNSPVTGSVWRDSGSTSDPTADDILIDLPGHFNPQGRPNCVPSAGWSREDFNAFPVFMDASNPFADYWDLPGAVRYLIYSSTERNPVDDLDLPEGEYLDTLLVTQEPRTDIPKFFDPDDPTTYTVSSILVADMPIDGKPWPQIVEHLIGDKGFAFAWELTADADDELTLPKPRHFLNLFRPQSDRDGRDRPRNPKQVWLQPRGTWLDMSYTNLGSMSISRDVTEVVNEWDVVGDLEEWEASFILDPGFPVSLSMPGDIAAYNKETNKTLDGTHFNKYRLFVADESGEGHYHVGGDTPIYDPLDLDDILGVPVDPETGLPMEADPDTGEFDPMGVRQYVHRRRPTLAHIFTKDGRGQPYSCKLAYSFDYKANGMQTLTPSGTLTSGAFTLGVGDETTGSLAYNADAPAIKAALSALPTVGAGNVTCSGGPIRTAPVYVFFAGDLAGAEVPDIAVTPSGVTGGTIGQTTQSPGGKKTPGLWDKSGTWLPIAGGFKVLPDRIGVYLTCQKPNAWTVGTTGGGKDVVLKVIECLEAPSNVNRPFWLRLTCAFRGDKRVRGTASKDATDSLLSETVKRTVEARDRYKKQTVAKSSEFAPDDANHVIRDDTDNAYAEAVAMQQATQGGILAGPITIPRFTDYYKLGDRIDRINGRPLGFRTDDNGESQPIYPIVEGITWTLDGEQRTTLSMSDANLARRSYTSKLRPSDSRRR